MKVTLEKNYKDHYTLGDIERAKAIIKAEKDDETSLEDWARYAAQETLRDVPGYVVEILKATATTAKNKRAWNLYGEDSGNMDIWIEATAETSEGFVKFGAYLSDIWQTGGTDYRNNMYIERYGRITA